MPRTIHPPKYRKHKRSGQAVVTLNGRDHYLGPHGTAVSKREYDRLVSEWLAGGRVSREPDQETTVAELLLAYSQFAKGHYVKRGKPTGEWDGQKITVRQLRDMYGDTAVSQFGPLRLKAFRESLGRPRLVKHGHRSEVETLTRSGINRKVSLIKRIFRWGASEELVPPSVITALETVTGLQRGRTELPEPEPVVSVSDDHVNAVLPCLTTTVRAMIEVQLSTGMRPNEVIQLRPGDIDRTGEVWIYRPASHKTEHKGRTRVIPLGPKAQEVLTPFLDRDPEAFCFTPSESAEQARKRRSDNRVTPLSCGNRPGSVKTRNRKRPPKQAFTADSYRRAIHRACDAAKIPRWSPNQLRHTAATKIRAEYGLEAARVVLGHSTTTTTEIYAERDLKAAAEIARALG